MDLRRQSLVEVLGLVPNQGLTCYSEHLPDQEVEKRQELQGEGRLDAASAGSNSPLSGPTNRAPERLSTAIARRSAARTSSGKSIRPMVAICA